MAVLRMLLEVTIYSGVLFLVILLFRAVFKRHASPAMLYAAWLLLAVRLLIPVTVGGISLIVLPAQQATVQSQQSDPSLRVEDTYGAASISPQTPAAGAEESAFGLAVTQAGVQPEGVAAPVPRAVPWEWDLNTALIVLWIGGAAVVLFNMAAAKAMLYKQIASAPRLPDEWLEAALRIQDELGVRSRVRVVAMRNIASPVISASLRPTIVIPMDLLWHDCQSVEFALRHELTHFKRGDHLVCLLLMLLRALYWFSPVVWLAARLMRMDMEMACDSRVVSAMDVTEKKRYASTILDMYARAQPRFLLGMALGHTRQTAERRVRGIFMRQRSARGTKAAALLLAAVMLVACFTTALQPVRAAAPERATLTPEAAQTEAAQTEAAYAAPTTDASDFEYEDHGAYAVITGYIGRGGFIAVPSEIDGKSVKGIAEYSFTRSESIASIYIPGSVEFIEGDAFIGASPLVAINVDPSNTYFKSQDGILYNHDMTTLLVYPRRANSSYTLPDSVTSIDEFAFDWNPFLTSITLPDNMAAEGITGTIFYNCVSLTDINANGSSLNYESQNGVLYNKGKTTLVRCPAGKTGAFTVPDGVTVIGEGAFNCCTELTSVTLPGSVRYIDTQAFNYCINLTSVNIPDGITEIKRLSFTNCQKLTDIVIPGSVTSIGEIAFEYSGLKSVTIPASVTAIGGGAFDGCADLARAVFAGDMPELESGVFNNTANGFKVYYHKSHKASWSGYDNYPKQVY